jgi:hypothetical protein
VSGGDQTEAGGGFAGVGETAAVADHGQDGLGSGEIDAGAGHQELDLRGFVGETGEIGSEHRGFGADYFEEEEQTVEGFFAEGVERDGANRGVWQLAPSCLALAFLGIFHATTLSVVAVPLRVRFRFHPAGMQRPRTKSVHMA